MSDYNAMLAIYLTAVKDMAANLERKWRSQFVFMQDQVIPADDDLQGRTYCYLLAIDPLNCFAFLNLGRRKTKEAQAPRCPVQGWSTCEEECSVRGIVVATFRGSEEGGEIVNNDGGGSNDERIKIRLILFLCAQTKNKVAKLQKGTYRNDGTSCNKEGAPSKRCAALVDRCLPGSSERYEGAQAIAICTQHFQYQYAGTFCGIGQCQATEKEKIGYMGSRWAARVGETH
jgi:hypothetical protein